MTTNELFDILRARHSLRSESQLANALAIPKKELDSYRAGRRPVDVDLAWRVAELLQRPPAEVIAVMFFEAETDPERRKRWRERMKSLAMLGDERAC